MSIPANKLAALLLLFMAAVVMFLILALAIKAYSVLNQKELLQVCLAAFVGFTSFYMIDVVSEASKHWHNKG